MSTLDMSRALTFLSTVDMSRDLSCQHLTCQQLTCQELFINASHGQIEDETEGMNLFIG